MRLIEGATLGQAEIGRSTRGFGGSRRDGRCDSERVKLLTKVARAVHYAHPRGILHRDLIPGKPLAFSPDSRWLALGGINGVVTIWNMESAKEVPHFGAHSSAINRAKFTAGSKFLVTAGYDHTLKYWEMRA